MATTFLERVLDEARQKLERGKLTLVRKQDHEGPVRVEPLKRFKLIQLGGPEGSEEPKKAPKKEPDSLHHRVEKKNHRLGISHLMGGPMKQASGSEKQSSGSARGAFAKIQGQTKKSLADRAQRIKAIQNAARIDRRRPQQQTALKPKPKPRISGRPSR
jgi:hypothetical protein